VESLRPADTAEAEVAQVLVDATAVYEYRLTVLKQYYKRTGAYSKSRWVDKERKNLDRAWTFTFEGLSKPAVEQAPSLDEVDEATLVEQVIAAREGFLAGVDGLAKYYKASEQDFKFRLATNIRQRFDPVRTYMYFLDAEVPPADLKGVDVIAEAEALYAEALHLHKSGKGLLLFPSHSKQRRALAKFLRLVRRYPTSTHIALSAYWIGEIYKEYFKEPRRAVLWYQRAWQWDPNISKPARFQEAVIRDYRLHDRDRALELYRAAIEHETFNKSNVSFSEARIAELTAPRQP
jgi:TolA-binding protein